MILGSENLRHTYRILYFLSYLGNTDMLNVCPSAPRLYMYHHMRRIHRKNLLRAYGSFGMYKIFYALNLPYFLTDLK